jgi:hypothetical protein
VETEAGEMTLGALGKLVWEARKAGRDPFPHADEDPMVVVVDDPAVNP